MPQLTRKIHELRQKTIDIIRQLLETGKVANQKEALRYIIKRAIKTKVNTGFSLDFEKAYQQYRIYKHRIYVQCNTL